MGISKVVGVKVLALLGAFATAAVQWMSGDRSAAIGIVCSALSSAGAVSAFSGTRDS